MCVCKNKKFYKNIYRIIKNAFLKKRYQKYFFVKNLKIVFQQFNKIIVNVTIIFIFLIISYTVFFINLSTILIVDK